jgi:transporter family-2 protein
LRPLFIAQTLAILAGSITALQSRVNGELSLYTNSSTHAALISFTTGLLLVGSTMLFSQSIRRGLMNVLKAVKNKELPFWKVVGGSIGGFFVATQSASVPVMGVALFTVAVVSGGALSSLIVDRYGISPFGHAAISQTRLLASALAVIGVVVAVSERLHDANFDIVLLVLSFLVGALVSLQHALNGHVGKFSGNLLAATFINFFFGTLFLVILLGIQSLFGSNGFEFPQGNPWWSYTGGLIGVTFIISAVYIINILGSVRFIMGNVAGQILGSLVLDITMPTTGTSLSITLLIGMFITLAAVVLANLKRETSLV